MPKFRKIIKDIQKDRFVRLGDIAQFSKETSDYSEYESGEFKYLEISGVSLGLNKYRTTTVSVSNAPSRAKMKTQDGDIVIALTRPHRGAIAQIKESGVISSTGFSVIRKVVTQIDREWLLFVLLSNLSLQQMLQRSSGGNYPAIIEDEVKRIYIPIVDYSKQLQMAANMRTKAKEFDAQIQTSNSFLNNTLFILERVGLTFDKDNNNLAFVSISQGLVDKICGFILTQEFREILINDKVLFLDRQLVHRKMYSKTTSKIVENTLISYLDKHIAALKKGERFELFSASTGINYCNLVHYISAPEEKYYSRRLSMRISQIINNNLSQMYYQITQHYCGYVSKNQQKKLITWANKLIQMNFSFDLFKMLVQCDARISKAAKTQLKVYLKQRIDAAKNKNNNGVVVYPTKQPYEELDQVGYWCLLNVLKAKDFQEFLGNSEAFDFYCEYAKFDFSRFDVSWLLNLYPHTLEQIAKNAKVKERVRVAIATTLDGEAIAPSDSQRLQSILVKHFC